MNKVTIYLTEQSIKELLEGLPIFDEEGTPYQTTIIPPKTNIMGLTYSYKISGSSCSISEE